MGAAIVLLLVGLGAMAAGVLLGRYYVPDDRQLRRTARHSRAYMRALSHLIARDHESSITELRGVVEENVDDVEPYFALGAMFRTRGEHERAIRVHQALHVREHDKRKNRQRAMYELALDFRAAGMPRRATRAMETVLLDEPTHEGALRALAALYEEQARFNEAADLWQRLGRRRNEDTSEREHHLLVAASQAALAREDQDSAKQLLKAAQKHEESGHFYAAAAELATAQGNHRAARDRLKQALIAEPALAPHLLPALIASEQGLAADSTGVALADDELAPAPALLPAGSDGAATALVARSPAELSTTSAVERTKRDGVLLVPTRRPHDSIADRVLAVLTEVEVVTGPRLEIDLIRAQLVPPTDATQHAALAKELVTRFPDALAARVATARLSLTATDAADLRHALETLVAEQGALAWTMRGRWQCAQCGHRPGPFSWRCGQCRRWGSLRMETGIDPPPAPPRERRAVPRASGPETERGGERWRAGPDVERGSERWRAGPEGLLGTAPDAALPAPTLDPGLTDEELAEGGARRSLLGRVGGWFSGAWRRGADR